MSAALLSELDAALPDLTRKIRVLDALSWPDGVEEDFLAKWRGGRAELPKVELQPRDHSADIAALETFISRCDVGHPAGNFLAMTARSMPSPATCWGPLALPPLPNTRQRCTGVRISTTRACN